MVLQTAMQYRTIRMAPSSPESGEAAEVDANLTLNEEEIRVLGSLVEKGITTPDYYPLTLNALLSACNQKSSRDPAVSYSEDTVVRALDRLREKGLARVITTAEGGRVPRYRHLFFEAFSLNQAQGATLCVLMLRGPQTVGEIRQRSARLYDFASLAEVEETLEALMRREPRPLAARLARQTGTKESRFAHLLSGEAPPQPTTPKSVPPAAAASGEAQERIEKLEAEVEALRAEFQQLRQTFDVFKKQFE